jgi:type II secretory pathway component GspD/PulD (secretin)
MAPALFAAMLCAGAGEALAAGKPAPKKPAPKKPAPKKREYPKLVDGRLVSKDKVTFWYYLKPVNRAQFQNTITRARAQHGVAAGKDYVMDRDDVTHILMVTAKPEVADLIKEILAVFEEDEPQIRVSIRIVETSTTADFQSGLDVSFDRKTAKSTFFRGFNLNFSPKDYLDNLSQTTASVPFQGASTMFGTVGVDSEGKTYVVDQKQVDRVGEIYIALQALSAYQQANILAQPDILVTNGQKAKVTTGGRYPYQKATLSGSTVSITTTFLTVGITFEVTPFLVGEDKVHLTVLATVENVVGFVEGAQGVKNPFTAKRDISTRVVLEDGAELVLGGLFTKENTVVEKGIPILSEIPILGLLFKSYWKTSVKKELLFFIRPKIIKSRNKFYFPGR